jgi:integrase
MSDVQISKKANGRYEVRWRESGGRRGRTFDRQKDADRFATELRRRQQVAGVVRIDQGKQTLAEFVETYWRLHAIPNLTAHTRASYGSLWEKHLRPRLGDRRLREITPKTVLRLRSDLESAGVGTASVRKAMAVLQSILSFAVVEEEIEFNAAAPVKKPRYEREREPVIFLPADVELVRAKFSNSPRDRALVSVLAYSGPRPEEALRLRWRDVGDEAIHFDGRKTRKPRWTPLLPHLAVDLREWSLASGRPGPDAPVFPAHDGDFWDDDDWRNWRRRAWQRVAPAGTRPRDLRSSYITVQVYAGVPLTEVARHCGTSLVMLDKHYAGVIANYDGRRIPADEQIAAARSRLAS